jgi:hypothetical protein
VNVRAVDGTAVEATDLAVTPEHRGQGYGQDLVAAAARVGARSGKSRVKLGSQDTGSGKLDGWYQSLGFNKTGKGQDGYTRFEAPTSGLQRHAVQRSTVTSPRESAPTQLDLSGPIRRNVVRRMEEVEVSDEERLAAHDERIRTEESEHQLDSWNRAIAFLQDPDGKSPLDQMTMKAAYKEAKTLGQNDLMQQISDLMSSTAKDSQLIEEFDDDVARFLYENGAGVALAARFVKEFASGQNPAISTGLMLELRKCGLLVIQAVIYRTSAYGANGMKYFFAIRGFTGNAWHKRCLGEWHVHWEAKNKAGSPGWKKGKNGDKTPTGGEMRAILGKDLWGRTKGSGGGNWE